MVSVTCQRCRRGDYCMRDAQRMPRLWVFAVRVLTIVGWSSRAIPCAVRTVELLAEASSAGVGVGTTYVHASGRSASAAAQLAAGG